MLFYPTLRYFSKNQIFLPHFKGFRFGFVPFFCHWKDRTCDNVFTIGFASFADIHSILIENLRGFVDTNDYNHEKVNFLTCVSDPFSTKNNDLECRISFQLGLSGDLYIFLLLILDY